MINPNNLYQLSANLEDRLGHPVLPQTLGRLTEKQRNYLSHLSYVGDTEKIREVLKNKI